MGWPTPAPPDPRHDLDVTRFRVPADARPQLELFG